EFLPNFALGDVSDETAEFHTRGRFRRNGRINPVEFPLNFTVEDVFDETVEFPPNVALGDVSPETAEFPPNLALGVVSDETAEFRTLCCFPRNGRISVVFRTRDVSDETAE
ncbi:MAG: hypothetical protein Q8881_04185, partial [Sweet potato little leaf phytoplasma]|nr:hypothetical protein [Sweet potato little leaf phytoplasma]